MADVSIANLPAFVGTTPNLGNLLCVVDVADTSESPLGTTKRIPWSFIGVPGGNVTGTPLVIANWPLPATSRGFEIQTNGATRWLLQAVGAEGGGNTGSPLRLSAYSDVPGLIDDVMVINRAAGSPITFNRAVTVNGVLTVAGAATLTGLVVSGASPLSPTFNTTTGATSDVLQLLFQRGGVLKWRLGTNINGLNADTFEIYNNAAGADAIQIANSTMAVTFAGAVTALTFNATTVGGIAYFVGGRAILRSTATYNILADPNGNDGIVVGDTTDPNAYIGGNSIFFRGRSGSPQYGFFAGGGFTVNVGPILLPTGQAVLLANEAASTLSKYMTLTNAGANAYFGIEGASGGGLLSGSSPYALVFGQAVAKNIEFFTNNVKRLTIDATGSLIASTVHIQAPRMTVAEAAGVSLHFWANPAGAANEKYWALGMTGTSELAVVAYDDPQSSSTKPLRFGRSGTTTFIGFYGVTPVARQNISGAGSVGAIIGVLLNLGLITNV